MVTTNDSIPDSFKGPFLPLVRELVQAARALILEVMPNAIEQVDPSANLIGYGTDRTDKSLICGIVVYKTFINLMFARGAELPDPDHLLWGTGKQTRHVRIQFVEDLYFPGVSHLLESAVDLHGSK